MLGDIELPTVDLSPLSYWNNETDVIPISVANTIFWKCGTGLHAFKLCENFGSLLPSATTYNGIDVCM